MEWRALLQVAGERELGVRDLSAELLISRHPSTASRMSLFQLISAYDREVRQSWKRILPLSYSKSLGK